MGIEEVLRTELVDAHNLAEDAFPNQSTEVTEAANARSYRNHITPLKQQLGRYITAIVTLDHNPSEANIEALRLERARLHSHIRAYTIDVNVYSNETGKREFAVIIGSYASQEESLISRVLVNASNTVTAQVRDVLLKREGAEKAYQSADQVYHRLLNALESIYGDVREDEHARHQAAVQQTFTDYMEGQLMTRLTRTMQDAERAYMDDAGTFGACNIHINALRGAAYSGFREAERVLGANFGCDLEKRFDDLHVGHQSRLTTKRDAAAKSLTQHYN